MDERLPVRDWRDDDRESRPPGLEPLDFAAWLCIGGLTVWAGLKLLFAL